MQRMRAIGSSQSINVAIIGAGGLGGPTALALAKDTNCNFLLIDNDAVELSNLARQVQFVMGDLGRSKVSALADSLVRAGCAASRVHPYPVRLSSSNIDERLSSADIVVESSDSFATKFLVNDWCVAQERPLALGACQGFEGHVFAVKPRGPCYRCLFEDIPREESVGTCSTMGILAPVVGIVAGHLALTAQSFLQRKDPGYFGKIWSDLRQDTTFRRLQMQPRTSCPCSRRELAA